MRKACRNLLLAALCVACIACKTGPSASSGPGPSDVSELIAEADRLVASQDFDGAMEKSLRALELSAENPLMQVRSLLSIVGVDIMASRDADAWEKAVEAEAIAREKGFDLELSSILIAKAKLCSYAEISPETGRNDEGLGYAREALALAEKVDAAEQQCEACYVIGSLYINKNRWNDPIDPDLYRTAGEWLDKGQALADTYDLPRLRRNGILFRSRWFQQGDRNEDAIRYFEQVLSTLKDSDHLTASSLDDRLVRLYTRTGAYEKALDTHDDYVFHIQKYLQQKQDETLQEMETRFQVQEKEREIERSRFRTWLLVLALLLASAIILQGVGYIRKIRRRNAELKRVSDAKEQIIQLFSKDLRNPANALADEIAALSESAATLSPDQIREKCKELTKGMESINKEVATYVENLLVDRSRRITDIGLSPREIEIIRLSAEGLKAAEIAQRTFLSVHTVNTHRQHIYAKMGVKNVADMLRKAGELGII
ncbi:MAG: helix-turn-helix transcriptional regulator [Bacteroidales bacterium]|nr:helix-turn-helix transcriptional regulator [Bacteroidales bacterium]MBQ1754935.1 helix-turn-helix transcriptional regulator [Bacteroidales bacterium]MBQ2149452.1 helix-turn-helix transcriptional regulator [Bacteroidales bacterium]MBQ2332164.1 helix-turn-helix transcriptional regulator [Bacteroidales bacterium]